MRKLLTHRQVDRLLLYPRGRTLKLANEGRIPFIRLPDGEIRFDQNEIDKLLADSSVATKQQEAGHA